MIELTPREQEVFTELVTTASNLEEIGKKLFLTRATINSHTDNIYHKFGVSSRRGLIINYYQNKIKETKMKTKEEIETKLEYIKENNHLTDYTKNFYWGKALKWVLEIEDENEKI